MARVVQRIALALAPALAATVALAGQALPAHAASAAEPAGAARTGGQQLPSYSTWISDVSEVIDQANEYLDERLSGADEYESPAIVLDIDNTALESSYSSGSVTPAIRPSLKTALKASRSGVSIFFVTARPESYRKTTESNLDAVGYPCEGVYLRSSRDSGSLQKYKTSARIAIERMGYTIIANIGNNTTDLAGGHAERTFKLPDYGGLLP